MTHSGLDLGIASSTAPAKCPVCDLATVSAMTVTVRQARVEDAEDIVQLQWDDEDWLVSRGFLAVPDAGGAASDISLAGVREDTYLGRWYVAELAGFVVAAFQLNWPAVRGQGSSAVLTHLVSDRNNKDLGGELVDRIGEYLRFNGVALLRAECASNNGYLRKYYQDQGFTQNSAQSGTRFLELERPA